MLEDIEKMDFSCAALYGVLALIGCVLVFLYRYARRGRCYSNAKLNGKTVIVTGANTGIGKETAKDMAKRGAYVILACRNMEKGQQALDEIKDATGNLNVYLRKLDLSSQASIKEFAKTFLHEFKELHILINNAGVMFCPYSKTVDGFEMHFGVNHLGHFTLTNLLLQRLVDSGPSRIINLSSKGHIWFEYMDLDDLHFQKTSYNIIHSYTQSKLANVLFTKELHRKLIDTNVTSYAVHPGSVKTELLRYMPWVSKVVDVFLSPFFKTAWEGAQTSIKCAVEEGLENKSGEYFSDCEVTKSSKKSYDEGLSIKLWEKSEDLTKTKFPL